MTNFCPTCPRDANGSLRELLENKGTKCHGCGYELLDCPTTFESISAKHRTDDRRHKSYNRKVEICFTDPRSATLGRAQHQLATHLDPRPSHVGTYDPNPRWPKAEDGFKPHRIHLTFTLSADKPSLIVSEAEAIRHFTDSLTVESLRDQINVLITGLALEDARTANRDLTARQATRLAEWIGAEAKERATDLTRYEQRLAALNAEFEAELKVQLVKFGPEADADIAKHNADPAHADDIFTDEELEIAKAHADRFAKRHGRGFLQSSPVITPDQVAEHRGEKESA